MSIGTVEQYGIYPAIFDSLTVNNIRNVQPSAEVQQMLITPGGSLDPAFSAVAAKDPTIRLSSGELAAILTAVSATTGLAITSSGEVQYQAHADGGAFVSGSNHFTLNALKGFLYWDSISAEQDSQTGAEVGLMFHALRSGANAVITANVSQPLSGSPAVNALYALGPVSYEGSQLRGVQNTSVNSGITYESKRADGETAAGVGTIRSRQPTIEISGTNLSIVNNVGFATQKPISSGLTVYFQKVDTTNERVAYGTTQHIAVTAAAGSYAIQEVPVSDNSDATSRLVATVTGTLSVSVGVAIPF